MPKLCRKVSPFHKVSAVSAVHMGRVHMGYFDKDFLRVRMEGFVWDIFDRNFFLRFSKSLYGRVRMGYLIENFFLRDFLRVHMGRVRMGYFNRDFFCEIF